MNNPKYTHDCEHCQFLGTIEIEEMEVDIYRCAGKTMADTWIARGSSEPSDYWSSDWDLMKNEGTAISRAMFKTASKFYAECPKEELNK